MFDCVVALGLGMRSNALRACCVVAAVLVCGADRALAQLSDVEAAPPPGDLSGGSKPEHFLFYSGFDIWRFGRAGYGGFYFAPASLNKDGFIVRLFVSGGRERYDAGSKRFNTDIVRASPLAGWRFKQGGFEIKLFAGPELENRRFDPDVPAAKLRGTQFGARVAAELWWEPDQLTMFASSFSKGTIANAWSVRGATGWRVPELFWAGPEISASGDEFSRQVRLGAHLTGFKLADFEWSAAAGYVQDSFSRNGVYGRIGVLTRQ
jgi:hypothetical protein